MSDLAAPFGSAGNSQIGKYRLLRRLASGGMAEVFLATDDGTSLWAVKLMLPHLSDQPEFLGLFLDEARLASLLNHVNVARVKDMGMEDGRLFIAMEYVRGQPLSNLLLLLKEKGQELTPVQAAEIVAQSAAGLNAAHIAKGRDGKPLELVHRDVSPQNLLLTDDGVVKVVDFGIAKARNKLVVTQANTTRGKPWYMSPEQMRGEPLDARADVFALGAVLFELLSGGIRLFDGDVDQVMYKALNEPLPDLAAVKPGCPPDLVDLVARACAYKRDVRQETAWEMEQELKAYVAGEGGAGDLGSLIREHFPAMPATVADVTGEVEPEPPPSRPAPRPARPRSGEAKPSNSNSRPRGLAYSRPHQEVAPPAAPSRNPTLQDQPASDLPDVVTSRDAGKGFAEPAPKSKSAGAKPAPASSPAQPAVAKAPPPVAAAPSPPAVLSDPTTPTPPQGKKATMAVMGGAAVVLIAGGGVFAWKMAVKEDQAQPPPLVAAPLAPPSLLGKQNLLAGAAAPAAAAPTGPSGSSAPVAAAAHPDDLVALDLTKAKPAFIRVSAEAPGVITIDGKEADPPPAEITVIPDRTYQVGFVAMDGSKVRFPPRSVHAEIGKSSFVFFGGRAKNIFSSDMARIQGETDLGLHRDGLGREELEYALFLGENPTAEHDLGRFLLTHDLVHSGVFHLENYLRMLKQQRPPASADKIADAQKEVDEARKKD